MTINIDKLKITFNNENRELKDEYGFKFLLQPDSKYSLTHQKNILIKYNDIDFCFLLHKNRLKPSYSRITLLNKVLYSCNFVDILNKFFSIFNIQSYKVSDLEISINTNKKLTRNFYNHYFKKNIILNKGYTSKSYLPTENRFKDIVSSDTIYLKKSVKSPIEMRIENKTIEIKDHSKKQYILNYYSDKGLSTINDIYRLELTIDFVRLRNSSRYIKYQNNIFYSDIITINEYSKLSYISQRNYSKVSFVNPYQIDINRLMSESYLLSLFDYFTIFNYQRLVKPIISIEKLIFENSITKSKPSTSAMISSVVSDEYEKIINQKYSQNNSIFD